MKWSGPVNINYNKYEIRQAHLDPNSAYFGPNLAFR